MATGLTAALTAATALRALCELNVIEQVSNVLRTTTVGRAWERGQRVEVHGFVYGLSDGLLRRVGDSIFSEASCEPGYVEALAVGRSPTSSCRL